MSIFFQEKLHTQRKKIQVNFFQIFRMFISTLTILMIAPTEMVGLKTYFDLSIIVQKKKKY